MMAVSRLLLGSLAILLPILALASAAPRILNGTEGQFTKPYVVRIKAIFPDYESRGVGTLIREDVAITRYTLVRNAENVLVGYGSNELGGLTFVPAVDSKWYSSYNPQNFQHDLALLLLETRVPTGYVIPIVDNWVNDVPLVLSAGQVSGFGAVATTPFEFPEEVLTIDQTVISNAECQARLGDNGHMVTVNHFCGIDRQGKTNACVHDEGAGFIAQDDGKTVLMGVLSFVTNMCRPEYPAVYLRVNDYRLWIDSSMQGW